MTVRAQVVYIKVVAHNRAVILSYYSSTMMNSENFHGMFYVIFSTKMWVLKSSNTGPPIMYNTSTKTL